MPSCCPTITSSLTTSSPRTSHKPPLRAAAHVTSTDSRSRTPSTSSSPTLSAASTADAGPSPSLPALPAPQLSDRVLALLRTPPLLAVDELEDGLSSLENSLDEDEERGEDDKSRFLRASRRSPERRSDVSHLRLSSISSDPSIEGSPVHNLQLRTPFLRPAPSVSDQDELSGQDDSEDGISDELDDDELSGFSSPLAAEPVSLVSAAVLANRARRPARGLTEDWIRQHTTGEIGEARHWLSDTSSGESENSSQGGSVSDGEDPLGSGKKVRVLSPHAAPFRAPDRLSRRLVSNSKSPRQVELTETPSHNPQNSASVATLKEAKVTRLNRRVPTRSDVTGMDPLLGFGKPDAGKPVAGDPLGAAVENSVSRIQSLASEPAPAVPTAPTEPTAPATPVVVKAATHPALQEATVPLPVTPPPKLSLKDIHANGSASGTTVDTPTGHPSSARSAGKSPKKERSSTRRVKKKLPWKGKSILVLLPIDEDRGKPGKAPMPLDRDAVNSMLNSWEELGYDIDGFDIGRAVSANDADFSSRTMSRSTWPNEREVAYERANRSYPVQLPDLNAWQNYVDELNEAKLRALGVSFGDDEPPLPPPPASISPAVGTTISRQSSGTMYPPLPFSPPIPTSSASSNHGTPLPFSAPFAPPTSVSSFNGLAGVSGMHSPSIPSIASPVSFGSRFNPHQSISFPPGAFHMPPQRQITPTGFPGQPALLQQGIARGGSPSFGMIPSGISPTGAPFVRDGFPAPPSMHGRHQSLQYPPVMQYQQPPPITRVSPHLQDLQEVDEDALSKSPSKTPEPHMASAPVPATAPFIQHNASLSLQKEIDDAEYHLEEQFRSQFEHDKDYSPHAGPDQPAASHHASQSSVQFAPQEPIQRFRDDEKNGPPLHHPRPHSRGHSLANAYYVDTEEVQDHGGFPTLPSQTAPDAIIENGAHADDAFEIVTNPSNLGTPAQALEYSTILPQQSQPQPRERTFSATSNPWSETGSFTGKLPGSRQVSHGSKASMSHLNVDAPEFKFNPAGSSTFQPNFGGQFFFGDGAHEAFQPSVFQAGLAPNAPPSLDSSQFSFPTTVTTPSKINANAPSFSPGQSDFSFSATGPKFRPDAPAFTPLHSFSNSLTSPIQSGSESAGNRTSSIFGNIDIAVPDATKSAKRSKAVAIVRPVSRHSPKPKSGDNETEAQSDDDRRITDDSRVKRARASPAKDGDDDEVVFAEPSKAPQNKEIADAQDRAITEAASSPAAHDDGDAAVLGVEDTTLSSTIVSESTDPKVAGTTSLSEFSPLQPGIPWTPFEFKSDLDIADFNTARPLGDDAFRHKKSLSATAKPFMPRSSLRRSEADELLNGFLHLGDDVVPTVEQADEDEQPTLPAVEPAVGQSTDVSQLPSSSPNTSMPKGLANSRFATSSPPSIPSDNVNRIEHIEADEQPLVMPTLTADIAEEHAVPTLDGREPTFEEIDDIMRHLNDMDPAQGVNKTIDASPWHQPHTSASLVDAANEAPLHLPPPISSAAYQQLDAGNEHQPVPSTEGEDPFLNPPLSATPSFDARGLGARRRPSGGSMPPSEWERDFTDEEQLKLTSRVNFFDGRVNEIVGDIISARLGPLEKSLERIQHAVTSVSRQTPPSRHEPRSISAEVRESDADDEDDDALPVLRRSMSPRRDRRLEQIRAAVLDALVSHQRNMSPQTTPPSTAAAAAKTLPDESVAAILKSLEDVKEHFGESLRSDFRREDLRNAIDEVVERRMPQTLQSGVPSRSASDEENTKKAEELQARVTELEERLRLEQSKSESEISARRIAEDHAAELQRKMELAETKIEVEIMNRSAYDQRVVDLEERLKQQEEKTDGELEARRAAEDRLSEVQRLLRISSEEETRLREAVDDREKQLKDLDETSGKSKLQLADLEATHLSHSKVHGDLKDRLATMEADLDDKTQEARHWRSEAERAIDLSQRQGNDLVETSTELRHLKKVVDTLGTQLEENERLRDSWRTKFVALQDEMSRAARDVAEESARYIKHKQTMLAHQEVLDAKLQAEARTRERLESELERLENGERQAMRAVSESKRLETILEELRNENHKLQQSSLRYQSECEEARESAAKEVQRTRQSMEAELDSANNQVNVVRGQLDQAKQDADTAKARLEVLLEEAETAKRAALEEAHKAKEATLAEIERRHQNAVEDLQSRHERQINNTSEDAQRTEQNLLERLGIATSKTEHLQERVAHLEEKLEITREAAQAAAKAAKVEITSPAALQAAAIVKPALHHGMALPEKISPQALRESIMVLQEQLQHREHRIEELEATLAKVDPEADMKISKRDDEILWLRELLAVRHSDLQDIVTALNRDNYDPERVRDAVIRLKANLQMEEQERERAINGGSAIKLPSMASIRDAATPRVAQAVGPLAAAWGSWRKARDSNASATFSSLAGALVSSPTPSSVSKGRSNSGVVNSATATPTRGPSRIRDEEPSGDGDSAFLSGLLTPPVGMHKSPPSQPDQSLQASSQRQEAEEEAEEEQQPTAFASTGRRYTGGSVSRGKRAGPESTPPPKFRSPGRSQQPVTPPMARTSGYDSDAQPGDFDDAAFFDN